jgi:hypothetical protein
LTSLGYRVTILLRCVQIRDRAVVPRCSVLEVRIMRKIIAAVFLAATLGGGIAVAVAPAVASSPAAAAPQSFYHE